MYIIASLFFIVGIAAGAGYGFMAEKSAMDMVIFIVAGGFAGSAAGGIVFTFLYFTGQNEDEKNEHDTFPDSPPRSGSIISTNKNISADTETNTPAAISNGKDKLKNKLLNNGHEAELNSVTMSLNEHKKSISSSVKRELFPIKLKLSQFSMPELKLKFKTSTEKIESKPAGVEPQKQETDRQKIKRLKKEIKKLKKNK